MKDGIKKTRYVHFRRNEMASALFHLIRVSSMEWMLVPTKESLNSKKGFIMDIFYRE
jgi:hypothetical protein